ncbi:SLC13 family permease [Kribbella sp. NPDC050820]|uniref:SLC13 family permease n=1 Tax=Kribbella sp. NPDC050820 TaxID=3155408 RepID=UPI0033C401C3
MSGVEAVSRTGQDGVMRARDIAVSLPTVTVRDPPGTEVFYSEHEGIDWNVIFLLLGMMIVIGIIKQTGVFDYLGIWAAKRSRGEPYRLMVMLMAITSTPAARPGGASRSSTRA